MSARTTVPGLLVVAKAAARAGADVLARRWTGHHPAVPLGIEEILSLIHISEPTRPY